VWKIIESVGTLRGQTRTQIPETISWYNSGHAGCKDTWTANSGLVAELYQLSQICGYVDCYQLMKSVFRSFFFFTLTHWRHASCVLLVVVLQFIHFFSFSRTQLWGPNPTLPRQYRLSNSRNQQKTGYDGATCSKDGSKKEPRTGACREGSYPCVINREELGNYNWQLQGLGKQCEFSIYSQGRFGESSSKLGGNFCPSTNLRNCQILQHLSGLVRGGLFLSSHPAKYFLRVPEGWHARYSSVSRKFNQTFGSEWAESLCIEQDGCVLDCGRII